MLPPVSGLDAFRRSIVDGGATIPEITQRLLLDTLGIGGQQAYEFLARVRPDQPTFEAWIVEVAGQPDPVLLSRYNSRMGQEQPSPEAVSFLAEIDAMEDVLSSEQLSQWAEDGYVVMPGALDRDECGEVADLLWNSIGARPDNPDSWHKTEIEGIMVPVFQQDAMEHARRSKRIHKAFAQLWGTADLWMTIDRLGFNPPERPGYSFNGTGLHWDVSLVQPIPFATQAVLYLSDTAEDQGAFRCVPGFHHRIGNWLDGLGDTPPREVDLSIDARTVPGSGGDLVIWRQDLPHGASPNRAANPRLAQYLNYYSPDLQIGSDWR